MTTFSTWPYLSPLLLRQELCSVFVTLPNDAVDARTGRISRPKATAPSFMALFSAAVELWWGLVEREARSLLYDRAGYIELIGMARRTFRIEDPGDHGVPPVRICPPTIGNDHDWEKNAGKTIQPNRNFQQCSDSISAFPFFDASFKICNI